MNNTSNDDPRHDPQRLDREWQAQERALEQERRGVPIERGDARLAEYRMIARALRAPAMEPVPADLTAQIVRRVEGAQRLNERLERWLEHALGATLAVAAAVAVAVYGANWLPAFTELWPQASAQSVGWGGLVLACLVVSVLSQWGGRYLRDHPPGAHDPHMV